MIYGCSHNDRSGLSLIEVLVAAAICGLLVALLLPAIQAVRESARATTCRSNLRQIGTAQASYLDVYQGYPSYYFSIEAGGIDYPPHVALLPFIDTRYGPLVAAGNFCGDYASPFEFVPVVPVPTFICPSDSEVNAVRGISFAWNSHWPDAPGFAECRRPQDITDGLSNTACMSEGLAYITERDPRTASLQSPIPKAWELRFEWIVSFSSRNQMDKFLRDCAGAVNVFVSNYGRGSSFCDPAIYDHLQTPNRRGCANRTDPQSGLASWPASSAHPGGVDVLYCDGRVRFERETIDSKVWAAIGTGSGNEPVSAE